MYGLQPTHLILILIIALVIFGPKRLPELGKSLGQSISEFKNAMEEGQQSADNASSPSQIQGTEAQNTD